MNLEIMEMANIFWPALSDSWFNVIWGVIFCVINFAMIIACFHFFGRIGMFTWIAIATIIANILVVKVVEYFTLYSTLGNVFYGSIFLSTDILTEHYGKKEAKRSIILGFAADLILIVAMQMGLAFRPFANDQWAGQVQGAMEILFGLTPRIVAGSLLAYLVSQFLDITIFSKIRKATKTKHLWMRNNGATLLSQIFDTLIFVVVAFAGAQGYSFDALWGIFITTYVLKAFVALLDTPFIYLSKHVKHGVLVGEDTNPYPEVWNKLCHREKK
ncbi:MAG: queuosine precursor transporter [Bacilli bacterium]|nr:queuosine precursor transporter [Bacilli bacterium]